MMRDGELSYKKPEIAILKFVAVLLIANSHLDNLYPLRYVATGGALGNAIFFFLSGYCLTCSYRNYAINFVRWYSKRIIRIYPVFLIVAFFEFITKSLWSSFGITDYVSYFIWPTPAWFVGAIMLFYLMFYFIMMKNDQRVFLYSIIVVLIVYFIWYFNIDLKKYSVEGPYFFKWCFYFIIMLFGGYVSFNQNNSRRNEVYIVFLGVLLYLGFGFLLVNGYLLRYQLIMHILTVGIVYKLFTTVCYFSTSRNLLNNNLIYSIISSIANLTLEIYLVQYYVYSNSFINTRQFPFNVILFLGITVALAYCVSKVARMITALNQFRVKSASNF